MEENETSSIEKMIKKWLVTFEVPKLNVVNKH